MINMDIDDAVQEDWNLTCISMLFGYYNLCFYVRKNGKFKTFVDKNGSKFDQSGECHIILPQFKELYEYVYSKAKKVPSKVEYEIHEILDEHRKISNKFMWKWIKILMFGVSE